MEVLSVATGAKPMSTTQESRAGTVEQRGIDIIPENERHGRSRDLFFLWLGTNTNIYYIINGVILISLGLTFWQCLLVILVGGLSFFLVGLTSIQGPRTGTSTFAINRASFGPRGGRVLAFLSWITLVGFEGSGVALAAIALLTLTHSFGWSLGNTVWFKVVIILVVAGLQIYIPTLGHATIVLVQKIFAWVFAIFFIAIAFMIGNKVQFTGGHPATLATITVGLAMMISANGVSWSNTGSDYSRYLPSNTRPRSIIWAVAIGSYVPSVLLEILGSAIATRLPGASDPISGLPAALPAWFLVPYLLLLLFNLLALNAIDLYSSGLTLQTVGLSIKRWQATMIDMVICTILATIAIFSSGFNSLYSELLSLLIVFLVPWGAIYLIDSWQRRNVYNSAGLLTKVGGPYWYQGGFNLAGVISQIGGMVAAALWVNSPLFQGPFSHLLGGSDMSFFTGAIVSGILYWLLSRIFASPQQASSVLQQEGSTVQEISYSTSTSD
jgi:purine-cytosine permease-like protein